MTTESLPRAASAEHLTDALRRSGALGDGRVCDVVVESARPTVLSRILRLRLTYEAAAAGAPSSIILKTGHPDRAGGAWHAGRQEVAFYDQVASAMPAGLVPRCFEAFYDVDTQDWHLLLEDLTDSHVIATAWPLPPTMEQCERILQRARASMRRGGTIPAWALPWGPGPTSMRPTRPAKHSPSDSRALPIAWATASRASGGISSSDCSTRRPACSRATTRIAIVTIVHGDAHVWNIFLPREGGATTSGSSTGTLAHRRAPRTTSPT